MNSYIKELTTQTNDIAALKDQFIRHGYESRNHSEWTMRTRKTHLKQFAEFCSFNEITLDELNNVVLDAYFIEYSKTHKKSTTNTGRRIMKVFLRWIEGYKEMSVRARPEAIELVKIRDKTPKYIDHHLIMSVVAQARAQDALLIEVCYRAGLRISELVGLNVDDVSGDRLHIRGKGEIDRYVYVTESLAVKLNSFIENRPCESIFRNTHGGDRPLSKKTAALRIQKCFAKSDTKMHPHQLRHSFAIRLLLAGCDIVTIQKLLGHADITTTQEYLRVADEHISDQYKKFMV